MTGAEFLSSGVKDKMGRGSLGTVTGEVEEPEKTVIPQTGHDSGGGWGVKDGRSNTVQYCRWIS